MLTRLIAFDEWQVCRDPLWRAVLNAAPGFDGDAQARGLSAECFGGVLDLKQSSIRRKGR